MRLWSLHPKYLDTKGIVAVWREALLAHRSAASLARLNAVKRPEPHPLFAVIPGAVETWERVQTGSLAAAERKPPQSISVKPMNTGGQIKAATRDDVSILTGLIRKSYRDVAQRFSLTPENCPRHPSNCTDDWIRNDFARGVSYYILEHNGRPAGCAALEKPDPDFGYLERLAVLPASRRKGFGRMLVDHVFNRAKDSGIQKISIGIIAAQTDLKRWYQKIGFIEGDTKEFTHLPFPVTFMTCSLPGKGGINAS